MPLHEERRDELHDDEEYAKYDTGGPPVLKDLTSQFLYAKAPSMSIQGSTIKVYKPSAAL